MVEDDRFAWVPLAAIADRDLTLEQLRVLLALLSFKTPESDVVFPRRQTIANMTGLHLSNISMATSALEAKGWLKKDGKGGHSKSTRYTITIPNTVAQSATVAEQATVAQSATGTVAEQATGLRVAESATGKEQTSEQTNRTKKGGSFDPVDWLLSHGVSAQHIRDWLSVRKTKRAANTETAFVRVLNQARLADLSMDRVVQIMAERNWQSFEADWIKTKAISTDGKQANPVAGELRNRGGRREVFNNVAGWVPA